ncbi:protein dbl-1 [Penaeus vannamei]|uniref:protein dbl-1 n=1 Tax=Penaeus vannamei TaxID=6689 RepID=UPI000F65EA5E|nr:protein 60A-like [Penaeus vannamei]
MRVLDIILAAILLLMFSGVLLEATARAAAGVNPQQYIEDASRGRTVHNPKEKYSILNEARETFHRYPQDPSEKYEEDQVDNTVTEKDNEDDDDEEEQDYEWSAEELEMIKQKILNGLGLTTVPTRSKANVSKEEYERAYSEYIRLVQEEEARHADSLLREYDEEEEQEEDVLRDLEVDDEEETPSYRFYSTGVTQHSRRRGRRSTEVEGQVVHFHVAVPVRRVYAHDLDVIHATCRLWKTGGPEPQDPAYDSVTVSVYRMDGNGRRRRRRKQPVLLHSLNVSVTGDEWLTMDLTEAVRGWIASPRGDADVLVQCQDCSAAGVTIHTGTNTSNTTYVPTLDVQTQLPAGRRVKRSRELTRATKPKWRRRSDCSEKKRKGRRHSRCCRRSMKVRFKDLPDFDFVESPEEFDAFYCSGNCPARFNPANEHALLQSLLKLKHKKKIPGPCCAPTALHGLHILHLTEDNKLATTYWADVIVTECGCA